MTLFANPDGSDARVADFLTGFSTVVGDNDDVRGKPVGIISGERGSLYITSDERAEMIMKIVPYRLGWNIEGTLPDAILVNTDLGLDPPRNLRAAPASHRERGCAQAPCRP